MRKNTQLKKIVRRVLNVARVMLTDAGMVAAAPMPWIARRTLRVIRPDVRMVRAVSTAKKFDTHTMSKTTS